MMGETSDLSALPVPSDGVHRILGQRLGPDSFSELGWTVLRNDPPADPRLPRVEADFVLADARQGVVLVQMNSSARPPAADQLRERLDAAGFAQAAPGFLPIVTVQLNDGDVWRLTGLLDFAVAAEPPIEVQGDWVALAQQALLAAPPAAKPPEAAAAAAAARPMRPALPLPEERQPLAPASRPTQPGRFRMLHLFWIAAVLTGGTAFGLLHYLGPPREVAAPASLQARIAEADAPVREAPAAPPPSIPAPPPPAAAREPVPVEQVRPAPPPAEPSQAGPPPAERQVAAADAIPLPPPPAPPVPPRPVVARAAPESRWSDEPPFLPEPEPPRELPPEWFVAKPPELDRTWFDGPDPGPAPQAAESGGPARIFVHHHRSRRDLADSLAGQAQRLGGTVEVRVVPATPPTGEVRYFNSGDREMAERLAATLGGSFRARSFTSFSPRPSRGTLEVWVPGRDEGWD
ncbi:hypothetical protein [Falsiroseomonas sp. E2-1-a20]|uniref:hypothetical protein n=1 Tax=Falsiroseomonas sp. E2-1-a20 TaxID=3239300 RepID=UPI003F394D44